ncbi:winged helix-turn-helix domain-containing protein [Streptomyces sp. NPDC002643]
MLLVGATTYLYDDEIERDAPDAPFEQLAGILKARIKRGDWQPNRQITSESRLGEEFGLSRPTVRRAIALLVEEGWLFVRPQRGTYVAGSARLNGPEPPAGNRRHLVTGGRRSGTRCRCPASPHSPRCAATARPVRTGR